jgi:tetratricopeptide (TPR) repeat protein
MSDENWLSIFRYASFVGGVIVAFSTIGVTVFQSRTDKDKDKKIDELLKQNNDLSLKIDNYQNDLKTKEEKIKDLQVQAKKSSRGITSTFDFNGTKRDTTAGSVTAIAGDEFSVFQRILLLEKESKFVELKNLCEAQIKKTPNWFTPYLYLGVAYANLGNKEKAISNLEYVIENTPGDPNYAQAKTLLDQLKAK